MKKVLVCTGVLAALGYLVSAVSAAETPTGGFTDVTESSGLKAVVNQAYDQQDKINQPTTQESAASKPSKQQEKQGWWLSGLDFVDIENRGVLDLFLSGHGTQAAAARNDGKGHFTYVDPKISIKRGPRAKDDVPYPGGELRLAYDFNEDGLPDLMVSYGDGGVVTYLNSLKLGTGGAAPTWNSTRLGALDAFHRSCAVIDINRDGKADFLWNTGDNGANNGVGIAYGDDQHSFRKTAKTTDVSWVGIPADIDGDGRIEFIAGSGGGYSDEKNENLGTRIYRLDENFKYADLTEGSGVGPKTGYTTKGVSDVNNDGSPDIICLTTGPERVAIFLNDGKGHFTKKEGVVKGMEAARKPKYYGWGMALAVDLDNDGNVDLIINGRSYLYVLRGLGGGNFEYANKTWNIPDFANSAVDEGTCFGDIDGDGRLDLITFDPVDHPGRERDILMLHNDLPKGHYVNVRPVGLPGNKPASGAKIRVYEAGALNDPAKLVSYQQAIYWGKQSAHWSPYTFGQTERHVGLGQRTSVDVSVEFYPSGKKVEQKGVKADSTVVIAEQ